MAYVITIEPGGLESRIKPYPFVAYMGLHPNMRPKTFLPCEITHISYSHDYLCRYPDGTAHRCSEDGEFRAITLFTGCHLCGRSVTYRQTSVLNIISNKCFYFPGRLGGIFGLTDRTLCKVNHLRMVALKESCGFHCLKDSLVCAFIRVFHTCRCGDRLNRNDHITILGLIYFLVVARWYHKIRHTSGRRQVISDGFYIIKITQWLGARQKHLID